jgi:ribonuclease Y
MFDTLTITHILIGIAVAVVALAAGYFARMQTAEKKIRSAEARSKELLEEAGKEKDKIRKEAELEAKDLLYKLRSDFDKETKERRQELMVLEKRLLQKEENIDRKVDLLEKRDREIAAKEGSLSSRIEEINNKKKELSDVIDNEKQVLQRISGMTADDAKRLLVRRMEDEAKKEAAITLKTLVDQTREKADKEARKIIGLAIQKCAADHTVESTVSVVPLPNDEMKGRIIGREGRNIRALEVATGIDVIIDDTPEAVILSGFDPVRREVAKIALERLLEDGRIHPGRIEEVVEKVKKEMEENIREEGEKAAFDLGIHGIHPELLRLIGRLKYRTSYGQNVLQHAKEVAYLMGVMASELKMDATLARRIGILHDVGKAVSHEVEGTHIKIGSDLVRKYGESESVAHAVEAHHQDVEAKTLMAVLIQAADAISASRPGARRETLETYVKRLEKLESIADSFKGVEKAYAIQAGREIRVMVKPDKITDAESTVLAKDITKKIEEGLEYPGQIKVTVIRETRAVEFAK